MWLREHSPIHSSLSYKRNPFKVDILNRRCYSQITNNQPRESSVIPVVTYTDGFLDKLVILDSNNKAGIYRWVNKVNGNTYIVSSVSLARRLRVYYDFYYLSVRIKLVKNL